MEALQKAMNSSRVSVLVPNEGSIAIELLHFHGTLEHSSASTIGFSIHDGDRDAWAVVLLNRDAPIQFLYNWSEAFGAAKEISLFPSAMKYRASKIYSKPKTRLWVVFCGLCALLLAAVALTGGIYFRQERNSAEKHAFVATDDPGYDVAYLSSVDNLMDVFVEYTSFVPGQGLAIAIDFEPDNTLAQDDGVTLNLPVWRHQLVSLRHLQRQPDHIRHCRHCRLPVQCIAAPASCRIRDGTRIQYQNKVYTCYDRY
ncbi:hypothetical protein C8J56DRAFT_939485 [Mycena floridula]|nr:hypothetical protein C8J56DRAFT_939485 [Mycena floridula]